MIWADWGNPSIERPLIWRELDECNLFQKTKIKIQIFEIFFFENKTEGIYVNRYECMYADTSSPVIALW